MLKHQPAREDKPPLNYGHGDGGDHRGRGDDGDGRLLEEMRL